MSEQRPQRTSDDSPLPGGARPMVDRKYTPRDAKLLRETLAMLCNYIWTRSLRPGEHLWSIPVDFERDFDCILSDAIDELVERRGGLQLPVVEVAREFIAYYSRGAGCSNCGGLPHADTCFVGRFIAVIPKSADPAACAGPHL